MVGAINAATSGNTSFDAYKQAAMKQTSVDVRPFSISLYQLII
jgi:hypothetical protein